MTRDKRYKKVVFHENWLEVLVLDVLGSNEDLLYSKSEFAADRKVRALMFFSLKRYAGMAKTSIASRYRTAPSYVEKLILQASSSPFWNNERSQILDALKNHMPAIQYEQCAEMAMNKLKTSIMKQFMIVALLLSTLAGCKKETAIPEENRVMAENFRELLMQHNYRLVSYTSEMPIDYEPSDTVEAKINHWEYVSFHLKDDEINFSGDGTIVIYQHDHWIDGSESDTLMRVWDVITDKDGVGFRFLDFSYNPLTYRLVSFSDSSFVVKATWNGNDVTSTFKAL
jgi:hypothetical protein